MTHGSYNVVQRYEKPMTHGSYNIVQPMDHGEFIIHGSWIVQYYRGDDIPMDHGLYDTYLNYKFPMTHGPYNIVQQGWGMYFP